MQENKRKWHFDDWKAIIIHLTFHGAILYPAPEFRLQRVGGGDPATVLSIDV